LSEHPIEVALGSIGRIRILRSLMLADKPMTRYALQKVTGLKSRDLKKDLDKLASLGWIKVIRGPRAPDKYVINRDLAEVKILEELFKTAGYL